MVRHSKFAPENAPRPAPRPAAPSCTVDGCERSVHRMGWCVGHHAVLRPVEVPALVQPRGFILTAIDPAVGKRCVVCGREFVLGQRLAGSGLRHAGCK